MVRWRTWAAAAMLAACASAATAAATEPVDARLRAAAGAQEAAVIATLHDLVAIESGSSDRDGLDRIAAYLARRLTGLGARVDRIPSTGGGADLVRGVFEGRGKLHILLIAHMDTVYDRGILASEPYHREGNDLYGPGIADDKGGVAVILHALALLRAEGWADFARVTVLFNPDEETGSTGSGQTIARLGAENDVVLSYEPSPAKAVAREEGVLLGAAGTAEVTMSVHGRAAHAGAAPEQGRNALLELAHRLVQTRDVAAGVKGAQLNWTTATAGAARNQIPQAAEAGGDARLTAPDAGERLLAALRARVASAPLVPDTTTTVQLRPLRPMYVAGPRGRELAELARRIYAELDGRPLALHPATNGGTDAGFAGSSGHPAVLEGLGLAGWGYHAKREYIEIDSIAPRLYLTARMLVELGRRADAGAVP
ncbi:MAG: M20/M25/M40 family metallo-hydrolase [Xanthomonadaceae bacterium]|nr:M20/M25/M40 family metallo-hydrolase [Xanthomonadaceae bacterium]MDE1963362.1 M20/M25/M40 family metallo-hydrolase [Xanthomonadaceae bacterium]